MYNDFAEVYDKLQDADYEQFVDYYEKIFKRFDKSPKLVLDLACGTGNITIPMAKRGYDMIGLDLSCEMLNIARGKAVADNLDILFLNQDMCEMELYGTVDAIVCALDGLNYITDPDDMQKVFRLAANYLNPGGLMIFDLNTEYKLREVLGGNTFVCEENDIYYVWQSEFCDDTKVCEFELNFFCEQPDGSYERFDEFQAERAYSKEEILKFAKDAGLELQGIYKPFEFATNSDRDERVFFVISKKMC
ncbi:MAG: methyltransferase domain-containing protein [Clostridia bacterium]|nr:methyltransferase domain-containing protein [Clostridia bacterium]